MNNIELIPVVELSFPVSDPGQKQEERSVQEMRELYYTGLIDPIDPRVAQYPLFKLTDQHLKTLIEVHTSIAVETTCSLFGGYVLTINKVPKLFPQCCGLLEEINDWNRMLEDDFTACYLSECHPAPLFKKVEDEIHIDCLSDKVENFYPDTPPYLVVDARSLQEAIKQVNQQLEDFAHRLNFLGDHLMFSNLAEILIWGR